MSVEKNPERKNANKIPLKIIEALSNLDQDYLIKSESYPFYPYDKLNISEFLDESKRNEKEEDEKEYQMGKYLIKKTLGKGTFGKVKLGIYRPTQEKVAIKILEKSRIIEKDDEIRVKREFEMLTLFSHPNVILVAEIFESAGSFYCVMEFCEGGELFNYIVRNRRLSSNEAAFFYYQLINGLEYIHSLGIVHRDLKPENLLLTKEHILKIIDFGLSNYFKKDQKNLLVTPCGSPCYASPEMVAGKKYNGFKIDIWSTGIILYAMLCGYLPFEDKDNDILFEKILECKLDFPKYISKSGKDLIEKILVKDPNKRITIKEIKKHPFYLKGKEIFESEFSIFQLDQVMKEVNTEGDINNIMDIHIIKDPKENEDNKNKNKTKKKEKIVKNEKNKRNKKVNPILNDFEKENLIMRINTEGDEDKKTLTIKKELLPDLEKDANGFFKKINNHSSKKLTKKTDKNKIKNKNINKTKWPFKNRDIIFTKNNNKKQKLNKLEEKANRNPATTNNKKLIKTTKYNNIKSQVPRKYIIGKSVNARKNEFNARQKNLIMDKINDTNIIKSKFNSKEKFDKNRIPKRENIYSNNINNIVNNEYYNKKLKLKFNLGLYNSAEHTHKKTNSTAKKNMKLTSFQTIDNKKNNKNYLDNLFNIHSNIKKYKQQLKDIKLTDMKFNDDMKIRLKNNINNENSEEKRTHNKLKSEILSGGQYQKIKINKDKLKLTKIYNNTINNKNELINIIDNTEEEETIKNNIENMSQTLNNNKENNMGNKTINPKNNKEKIFKKKLLNLKYYMNEIEKSQTFRKEEKKKNKHAYGLRTDILNSIEIKKGSNFNLKKMLINDFNKKTKKNENEKILILNNLPNDNINLNTIDDINRTEPNQMIHIKKKIKNNNKYENKYHLSNEKNKMKKKISKNINIQKNIHLNSNKFIKKQKINFNENKHIEESNYEKA